MAITQTNWLLCYRLGKIAKPKHLGPDNQGALKTGHEPTVCQALHQAQHTRHLPKPQHDYYSHASEDMDSPGKYQNKTLAPGN